MPAFSGRRERRAAEGGLEGLLPGREPRDGGGVARVAPARAPERAVDGGQSMQAHARRVAPQREGVEDARALVVGDVGARVGPHVEAVEVAAEAPLRERVPPGWAANALQGSGVTHRVAPVTVLLRSCNVYPA